ncbi:argininosuccinate lyase [Chitinivibrio alkaliphilus]|uniref:Argininosuccinate lyase n=1 Tax=Chitinivibrio alkaliphilus ACht1 TaxID=1313304 RepID=U7D7E4_9BACT|nr:argininosuccinate lyase [Chitinivibrio alkaliphilus]ERP31501.1 argininosuccinate lyase [Chitinivibrio alkaliphilus ACht1]
MAEQKNKMWDGRFSRPSAELMERFNNSLPIDQRLIEEDIRGSKAWAGGLLKEGVLTAEEFTLICSGLDSISARYRAGEELFTASDEDIHMAVERLLGDEIGEVAAKLHTGRSRNDQVATDFRLYVKNSVATLVNSLTRVQKVLLTMAERDRDVIIPGYTHYQQAQPVALSHYWLSFFFILDREKKRLHAASEGADILPLGSGAIAGSGFAVDRSALAEELGFSRITDNSMDGVAARDFVLEALHAIASLGITISRYAEDLIVWSTYEFGFIELDDQWSTGSSMMPQKKNPDSLELIRGKSGRFLGNYTRFATTLKGIGLTYFKDLQEDKEPFIDSYEEMNLVLSVCEHVLGTLAVRKEAIAEKLNPFLLATDVADYLVRKGVPFRKCHHIVGRLVGDCIARGVELTDLSVEALREYSPHFGEDVQALFSWETALKGRDIYGGTGPGSVEKQLAKARELLNNA